MLVAVLPVSRELNVEELWNFEEHYNRQNSKVVEPNYGAGI
jgi:hypothetical protein